MHHLQLRQSPINSIIGIFKSLYRPDKAVTKYREGFVLQEAGYRSEKEITYVLKCWMTASSFSRVLQINAIKKK